MTDKKVWFITGASRGMGVDFAKAALAAGHAVVATGRDTGAVAKAVGEAADLLVVKLDVTSRADAEAAARAAVDRFGRIDVLVNNAANFYAGYFEELTPEQIERQLATSLIGPMNVTRAVLPVLRKQRSGHIVSISSSAGLVGFEFCSAYAASKFGLEGWMESLQAEVAPFGISTTVVNPGFFRTELLTPESTRYAEPSIEDYAERTAAQQEWWKAQSGQQGGDPAKLAQALITIASEEQPPRRFIAGADAIATAEQKVADLQAQIDAYRDLSTAAGHLVRSMVLSGARRLRRRRTVEIKRNGSQPSRRGPAEWFTGTVRIDPLFDPHDPARAGGASVTFEPGARTAWHTHPLGQTLIVTAGCGWAQSEGGSIEEIRPGDVIWFPPGEKHWHGATPTTAMSHIAIQAQLDGKTVEWMEKVSDEHYQGARNQQE